MHPRYPGVLADDTVVPHALCGQPVVICEDANRSSLHRIRTVTDATTGDHHYCDDRTRIAWARRQLDEHRVWMRTQASTSLPPDHRPEPLERSEQRAAARTPVYRQAEYQNEVPE